MTPESTTEKDRYEVQQRRHQRRYGLTGPVILVSLGVIFLVGQFVPAWGVARTWPVLLIVIGITKLLESAWSRKTTPPN